LPNIAFSAASQGDRHQDQDGGDKDDADAAQHEKHAADLSSRNSILSRRQL
jgi:hypothetical protein